MINYAVFKWLLWIQFSELVANKPRAAPFDKIFFLWIFQASPRNVTCRDRLDKSVKRLQKELCEVGFGAINEQLRMIFK